jgi:hypothetical protein
MKKRAYLVALIVLLVGATATMAGATGIGGTGDGFLLSGTAQNAHDPENPANDVIKIDTTLPGSYGTISRALNTKISALDNELEFKSYFQNHTCGGGSPRIQLAIDLNGDGVSDGNAFGYTVPLGGCAPDTWRYDDTTDAGPRWDVSQLVASGLGFPSLTCPSLNPLVNGLCPFVTNSGYVPWNVMETVLTTAFPLHQVCSGALVDDSAWLPGAAGVSYYDVVSLGHGTWHASSDTAGRGFAQGCGQTDCDDQDVAGDEDHDHRHTHNDDDLHHKRYGD